MTNKSIGSFLAELRKEKGLTQKEVADFLNVSDKTVSHWECDKYSPDISVIPLLAEFFGVTCDEILRGEKKAPENNEINETGFSYEPLTKENEFEKYARIRILNAYNKLKLANVIAVFASLALWAGLYVVIQLVEHRVSGDFEEYGTIIAAFFAAATGAITLLSAHLRFMSSLNMCPFVEKEHIRWRRKALSLYILPIIIFGLICISTLIVFMPTINAPTYDTQTMPISDALENEGYYEVDPSEVVSGEVVVSAQDDNLSYEEYASGEVAVAE